MNGWGGARMGAGRKKRPLIEDVIARSLPREVTATSGPDVNATQRGSGRLEAAVQRVYEELAPRAREQGTLIPATEIEFRTLCRHVLIQRRVARSLLQAKKIDQHWRQLERSYDSITRRLEVKLRSFRLAPMGNPMIAPQKPAQTSLEAIRARRQGLKAVG